MALQLLEVSKGQDRDAPLVGRSMSLVARPLERLPRVVVLDMDGTIVESEHEYIREKGLQAIESLGIPAPSLEEWRECVRKGCPLGYLDKREQDRWEAPFWDELNRIPRPAAAPLPGTRSALEMFHNLGAANAIFTARYIPHHHDPHFEDELRELGLLHLVNAYEGRRLLSISSRGSDKSVQLRALCEALQVPASEMMIIGDSPCDIEAGHRCHALYKVLVRSGGLCDEVACGLDADLICDSVFECACILADQFGDGAHLRAS